MRFSQGFKVDVGSVAPKYYPSVQKITDLSEASTIRLKLKANNAVGELKNFGHLSVFARSYKTNPEKQVEYYGIDILKGKTTRHPDSADITISPTIKSGHPKFSVSSIDGGLVPFFDSTDSQIAPQNGYLKTYELDGNEKGFFIRCRDGKSYARLSIVADYSRSAPCSNGHFEDVGIMFDVELQTNGNEFNVSDEFRLDQYILQGI